MTAPVRLLFRLLCLVLIGWPTGLGAQQESPFAHAPFLPADHWSRAAIRDLAALGFADPSAASRAWPIGRSELPELLVDPDEDPSRNLLRQGLTSALTVRIDEEFGLPGRRGDGPRLALRSDGGWAGGMGGLIGGTAVRDRNGSWAYPGPLAAETVTGGTWGGRATFAWSRLAVAVSARSSTRPDRVDQAYASVEAGPLDVWAGRHAVALGPGANGSVVLSGGVPFDGLGVRTNRSLRGPGPLRVLGPVHAMLLLARLPRSGTVERPWFTAARVTMAPTPSVVIGLNRAALFGGSGNVEPMTPGNLALMVLGVTSYLGKDSGFENQVASLDVWARGTVRGMPFAAYMEWGIDDIGVRFFRAPAVVAGVTVPRVPGASWLSLTAEHTYIAESCCGKPAWYRHGALGEGWTDRGRILGHPLGGHGTEWSVGGHTWQAGPLTFLSGRVFTRFRGPENLYAPNWTGRSVGGSGRAHARIGSLVGLDAETHLEHGRAGWRTWQARFGATLLFLTR